MNKEIESLLEINETIITREQRKEHRTLRNDETVLLMNNIKIKEYIQELEFQNTALKAEHNHNIDKIKELEQKESILDKVTDKLKEKIEIVEMVIDLCNADGRIAKYKIEQQKEEKKDLQEILNIIV